MISTRGRYALRVMIDLAGQEPESFVPLRSIAERQEISPKYLESIIAVLAKAGLVETRHGKGGGYRLTKEPAEYRVGDILRLTEGDLAPVACLSRNAAVCSRSQTCKTLSMWKKYDEMTNQYFDGITLADLLAGVHDS